MKNRVGAVALSAYLFLDRKTVFFLFSFKSLLARREAPKRITDKFINEDARCERIRPAFPSPLSFPHSLQTFRVKTARVRNIRTILQSISTTKSPNLPVFFGKERFLVHPLLKAPILFRIGSC